ncbi:putative toxin-antitoxin system toxin component, PIN family [bacterium]|nr:putative toxin-antitoxin system toxin component, PIN family [bacterium]
MKIVLDTNVIVSAFGTQGLCAQVFAHCLFEHKIIISEFIIEEVVRALEEKFKLPKQKTKEHRQFLFDEAKVVIPLKVPADACDDPKDLEILGTAWADKADVIITGDKHLLSIKEFKGISILSVREFWEKSRRNV